MRPYGHGFLFVGRFLITDSISLLRLVCSNFLFLPDSVLEVYLFLVIYSFLTGCPVYWHIIVGISYVLLYFCAVGCTFSCFISDFIFWVLSLLFFLMSLTKGLSILFYLSKEPTLSFIDLFYSFLKSLFIYFCSNLYYFFSSANFGFCLFFFF